MDKKDSQPAPMLLHACCGPCTMEPLRIIRERKEKAVVFYANSNIHPREEYDVRLETLRNWAGTEGVEVVEGGYDHSKWEAECGTPFEEGAISRKERCRACYRLRFEEAADFAKRHGMTSLCTTLSVSPYQYTDIIQEELERACANAGIEARFEDFRTHYDEATRRSREAGMYRQNYCGCEISEKEAAAERAERKRQRAREKEQWLDEHAEELERHRSELERKRAEKRAYAEKRARQKAILKSLRQKQA